MAKMNLSWVLGVDLRAVSGCRRDASKPFAKLQRGHCFTFHMLSCFAGLPPDVGGCTHNSLQGLSAAKGLVFVSH